MYLYMCIYTYPRWGGLHINNYNNELANKVKIEATSKPFNCNCKLKHLLDLMALSYLIKILVAYNSYTTSLQLMQAVDYSFTLFYSQQRWLQLFLFKISIPLVFVSSYEES